RAQGRGILVGRVARRPIPSSPRLRPGCGGRWFVGSRRTCSSSDQRKDRSMLKRTFIATCATAAVLAAAATASQAQTVRTIVPFGPGGAPDTIARALAEHISKEKNVTMVVE